MKYLYIGRFQPFHLGHLDAIQQALSAGATHIMIGLGSPDVTNKDNPWTSKQRQEMILLGLEDAGLDMQLFSFELIPDVPSDLDRYNYIIDELPAFDIIMSGNTWVQEIFGSCPYEVFDPEQESKVDIHATQIRTWLNNGGDIKISKYLSPEILTFILNNT